jgi:putative DNA methylase
MVDDPSSVPDEFPTKDEQDVERQRLFRIIEELVKWENSTNETVLHAARTEIARSVARQAGVPFPASPNARVSRDDVGAALVPAQGAAQGNEPEGAPGSSPLGGPGQAQGDERIVPEDESTTEPGDLVIELLDGVPYVYTEPLQPTPELVRQILDDHAPPVLDPFCGGGSIPLEAQRLGLRAIASDLNPVAVLITKALIEIPPKFAGQPPINPRDSASGAGTAAWRGATGLAADVRYYGAWMRDEAWKRIGHLYPKVKLPPEQGGGDATVIAWLWARTVKCPNPACGAQMPLVRSFVLSSKKGREVWVEPIIDRDGAPAHQASLPSLGGSQQVATLGGGGLLSAHTVRFEIRHGSGAQEGTKQPRRARCLFCGTDNVSDSTLRGIATRDGFGAQALAVVAEGSRGRVYIEPAATEQEMVPGVDSSAIQIPMATNARWFSPPGYGLLTFASLFTPRQLVALTTFSDLLTEAREQVLADGGDEVRADAVATYLALAVDKATDYWSSICSWHSSGEKMRNTFARQAIPMVWDYAECCPFSQSTGNWMACVEWGAEVVEQMPAVRGGSARQADATSANPEAASPVVSTDPPYYDNIGYADLSDFFYVWLRRSLRDVYPELFRTLLTPKAEELVATPYRFEGSKQKAEQFFKRGLEAAFGHAAREELASYPMTVFYAYKQAESDSDGNAAASTGWDTMLEGLIKGGFAISGTLPVRTELSNRPVASGTNALASSVVLTCRIRDTTAGIATRKEFVSALRQELKAALAPLRSANIAPVDLAQASIGPGMAIFSRFDRVLEPNGDSMTVRAALSLINQELAAVLSEQEGDVDTDTSFCISWFDEHGLTSGEYGRAETLAKAKNTSVEGLNHAGVLEARGGKVRLLARSELAEKWDPVSDKRLTDWECAQHLIIDLENSGEQAAARLARRMGPAKAQTAHDLAYLLFSIADRKGRTEEALAYNSLVTSWPEIQKRVAEGEQGALPM